MVSRVKFGDGNAFKCDDCGLLYRNEKIARKCEAHCTKYHSCNIQITKYAINKHEMAI